MKVELLVNLKVSTGKIISAGTVFSDEGGTPIPEFVMRRLQRRQAKVLSYTVVKTELPTTLAPKTGKKLPVVKAVGKIPKAIGKKGK